LKHKTFVNYLYENPYMIERRFRPLFKEFPLGRGKVDIIGKDKDGVLCLVEVKTRDSERLKGERQVKSYQRQLLRFLSLAGVKLSIRGIVVTPKTVVDVGTKTSNPVPQLRMPIDVPTSRELFGLKKIGGGSREG